METLLEEMLVEAWMTCPRPDFLPRPNYVLISPLGAASCLFKHFSKVIKFSLVVDDFVVSYTNPAVAEYRCR